MKLGFWGKIKTPFFALAPMLDITDSAFRQVIAKRGKPDIFYTWLVSADGLCSEGKNKLIKDLYFKEKERPIVAQIFGTKPENFYKAAGIIKKLGFDGIDVNMGCPEKKVIKQGVGAALIKKPKLAKRIIEATIKGSGRLPVSVKTRLGFDKNIIEEWISKLLEANAAAIAIHGRTAKELSGPPANWDAIGKAVEIRNEKKSKTLIIGNGDIKSLKEGKLAAKKYKTDGVMIGRASIGNPWVFNPKKEEVSEEEKLTALKEHIKIFEKIRGGKNFNVMKKHFAAYLKNFKEAKKLRMKLMEAKDEKEAILALNKKI